MSNQLNIFTFEGRPLNVMLRDGEPWWAAADVIKILGLKGDARNYTRYMDADHFALYSLQCKKNPHRLYVSEAGLYTLIFKSHKPEAKRFRRWVTSEVLPAIRKTGSYAVQKAPQAAAPVQTSQTSIGPVTLDVSALTPTQRMTVHALVEQLAQAAGV